MFALKCSKCQYLWESNGNYDPETNAYEIDKDICPNCNSTEAEIIEEFDDVLDERE